MRERIAMTVSSYNKMYMVLANMLSQLINVQTLSSLPSICYHTVIIVHMS